MEVIKQMSLVERAQEALSSSPLFALRRLSVRPNDNSVCISGRVATFYQKQQAQETVRSAVDGMLVVNDVEVT